MKYLALFNIENMVKILSLELFMLFDTITITLCDGAFFLQLNIKVTVQQRKVEHNCLMGRSCIILGTGECFIQRFYITFELSIFFSVFLYTYFIYTFIILFGTRENISHVFGICSVIFFIIFMYQIIVSFFSNLLNFTSE